VDVLRGSGPVGTLEGLGTLRNLGQRFSFTWGAPDELRVLDDLWAAAQAGRIQRGLRSARFGLLPARNEQMQSTFVDEFRLLADIGPSVIPLSVADLVRQIGALSTAEVDAYVSRLKADYRRVGVDDAALVLASRASLGLARLAVEQRLDVLAFNDLAPELHTSLGLRPCLYPPLLEQNGVLVGLEGDLGAATALYILQHISGSPSFFVEIWYWDEAQNIVVGGHAGVQNPAVAQPGQAWISYDYEFAQADHSPGAHFQFIARPGRVTLLQLRCTPSGWQALLASGEAVGDEPWLEGYPHAAVRLDLPLDAFVRRVAQAGSTQHWIMVYGDLRREAAALCELCQIPVEKLYE
jgi:L-fucose isomerase-like protein